MTTPRKKAVEEETEEALADIRREFDDEFKLMDEVLRYVKGVFTRGELKITRGEGLNEGIVTVSAGIITKGIKTFRAIRVTAEAGCGQDASVLLRALLESTISVLYILQQDCQKRAMVYAAYEDQRRLVMLTESQRTAPDAKSFEEPVRKAQDRVDQWSRYLSSEELAAARKHWSLEGDFKAACSALGHEWLRVYNTGYRYLSGFTHGGDLSAHIFANPGTGVPVLKLLPGFDELDKVLPTACKLLLVMCGRFDERLGLGLATDIHALRERGQSLMRERHARKQPAAHSEQHGEDR